VLSLRIYHIGNIIQAFNIKSHKKTHIIKDKLQIKYSLKIYNMIKQTIYLLITICMLFSCATPSQVFLANKHDVNRNAIKVLAEEPSDIKYSPIFELEDILYTSKKLNTNNYDSIYNTYLNINDSDIYKSNCISYDIKYSLKGDTLMQRVYFIKKPAFTITHDNDIIEAMHSLIKLNLNRFQRKNNHF
jgi:hypothetical protein